MSDSDDNVLDDIRALREALNGDSTHVEDDMDALCSHPDHKPPSPLDSEDEVMDDHVVVEAPQPIVPTRDIFPHELIAGLLDRFRGLSTTTTSTAPTTASSSAVNTEGVGLYQRVALALELNLHAQTTLANALTTVETAVLHTGSLQATCRKWTTQSNLLDHSIREDLQPNSSSKNRAPRPYPFHTTVSPTPFHSPTSDDCPSVPQPNKSKRKLVPLSQAWFVECGVSQSADTVKRQELQDKIPTLHKTRKWRDGEKEELKKAVRSQLQRIALERYRYSVISKNTQPESISGSLSSMIGINVGAPQAQRPHTNQTQQDPAENNSISAPQNASSSTINTTTPQPAAASTATNASSEQPNSFHLVLAEMDRLKTAPTEDLLFLQSEIQWNRVQVSGRTPMECKLQWQNLESPSVNKKSWDRAEDKKLLLIAKTHKQRDWRIIAQELGSSRSPIQCFSRYQRSLNANLLRSEWTPEDDQKLNDAVAKFGEHNWQQVASCLNGKIGQQCLHRWKAIKPGIKHGKWSPQEDAMLTKAVQAYGVGNWTSIKHHVPKRTDSQCRERWCNVLDPLLHTGSWTHDEDEKLKAAVNLIGLGKWSQVSQMLFPRTDNQCWRRWKQLHKPEVEEYLQQVKLKRAGLVSNFVGRESERSQLTAEDFEFVHTQTHNGTQSTQTQTTTPSRNQIQSELLRKITQSTPQPLPAIRPPRTPNPPTLPAEPSRETTLIDGLLQMVASNTLPQPRRQPNKKCALPDCVLTPITFPTTTATSSSSTNPTPALPTTTTTIPATTTTTPPPTTLTTATTVPVTATATTVPVATTETTVPVTTTTATTVPVATTETAETTTEPPPTTKRTTRAKATTTRPAKKPKTTQTQTTRQTRTTRAQKQNNPDETNSSSGGENTSPQPKTRTTRKRKR